MQQKTLAVQSLEHIESLGPQLGSLWNEEAGQLGYRLAGGTGRVQRALEPMINNIRRRLYGRLDGSSLSQAQLPVKCISTCSPNAITIFHDLDQSYVIGFDQATAAWQGGVLTMLLEAERVKNDDKVVMQRLLFLFDLLIAQRYPDRAETPPFNFWTLVKFRARTKSEHQRWGSLSIPLSVAWCDFIMMHELGHIELGHLRDGECRMLREWLPEEAHISAFLGNDREFEADHWALQKLRNSEMTRELDEVDRILLKHWNLREVTVRAARVPLLEVSIAISFLLLALVEPLFPDAHKRTHPESLKRIENLGLTDGTAAGWLMLEAVRDRLIRIIASEAWTQLIHSPRKKTA